jgi:hypothetical protein
MSIPITTSWRPAVAPTRRHRLYSLFLIILLTTEFNYISIGTGTVRIYHMLLPIVLLSLVGYAGRLWRSPVFLFLAGLVIVNFVAVGFSGDPDRALLSSILLCANASIAIAVALMFIGRKISIVGFTRILTGVTAVGIVWGLFQMLAFRATGITLALSLTQVEQIQMGFGPGFFNEANGFGKFMVLPLLFLAPFHFRSTKPWPRRAGWTILMIVGVLMNFTRSALYGILGAVCIVTLWYAMYGNVGRLLRRGVGPVVVLAALVLLVVSGAVPFSDYGSHKLEHFFDEQEILEGDSASFRLESMRAILDTTLADPKKIWIGNGWGQVYAFLGNEQRQAGGGDIVTVFGYSGLFGVLFYLLYTASIVLALIRAARRSTNLVGKQFAEGLLFAFVGTSLMSLVSGVFLFASYWMIVGAAIYVSLDARLENQ